MPQILLGHNNKVYRAGEKKTLMNRKRTRSAPAVFNSPAKRTKHKQWRDSQMIAAMNAVKHGKISLNEAATAHGIPKITLKDRVTREINPGPRQDLDKNEEKEF